MRNTPAYLIVTLVIAGLTQASSLAHRSDYPKPSPYPISWELKFDHSKPKRITVELPGGSGRVAYWYVTYTVTNNGDKERTFLPDCEMLTRGGKIIRSDNNISPKVMDAIKEREHNKFLLSALEIAGELRVGDDQAKQGVAIWREPEARMGTFTIYVSGLSGEIAQIKDDKGEPRKDKDGQPVILRKTLELIYQIPGDEVHPGEDVVNEKSQNWVMR